MPKKCLRLRPARSVPEVASHGHRHRDCQSSSSSSLSTRSSSSLSIKQFKKAQLAEKKAVEKASRLGGEPTAKTPRHLVSHMLPYFYPNDYTCDDSNNNTTVEVPPHLVSHVNTICYPKTGTVDDENVREPRTDEVPLHLVSHVNTICYPETGTADDENVRETRPDIVPKHLETHVALYCQPVDDDGTVIDWPSDADIDDITRSSTLGKRQRTNVVPQHLTSHVVFDDNRTSDKTEHKPGIRCTMTRDHPNMRDSVFADLTDKPFTRRVGGRRAVANHRDLFEESKPKPRPMSITIVQRAPENTKENIFGSDSQASRTRRRWDHDTMKTVFCREEEEDASETMTSTTRGSKYEDTTEKLFGETYGIDAAVAEYERRRRPAREDTQKTLFGPPNATTPPQRPQSALSFTTTHQNLFGTPPQPQNGRRTLQRENTFDNLFGVTPTRSTTANATSERYTAKNPKAIQASSSS